MRGQLRLAFILTVAGFAPIALFTMPEMLPGLAPKPGLSPSWQTTTSYKPVAVQYLAEADELEAEAFRKAERQPGKEAKELYARALALRQESFGPDATCLALSLRGLAAPEMPASPEKLEASLRLVSIRERELGKDAGDVLVELIRSARTFVALQAAERGGKYFANQRAPGDSPERKACLSACLSHCLLSLGNQEQAAAEVEACLAALENSDLPDKLEHEKLLSRVHALRLCGEVAAGLNNQPAAARAFNLALENAALLQHKDAGAVMCDTRLEYAANLMRSSAGYAKAYAVLKSGRPVLETKYQPRHPAGMAYYLRHLASAAFAAGDTGQAVSALEQAEKLAGNDPQNTEQLTDVVRLADYLERLGRFAEAMRAAARARVLLTRHPPEVRREASQELEMIESRIRRKSRG